jgi:peptide/nickel transport system substrate-binding protein
MKIKTHAVVLLSVMILLLASCGPATPEPIAEVTQEPEVVEEEPVVEEEMPAEEEGAEEPRFGGELYVARESDVYSMDPHTTVRVETAAISMHFYEKLFDWDANNQPAPMLAEGYEVSDDGLAYTIKLREGVTFHNGKEMTSEDVVASLERWLVITSTGRPIAQQLDSIEATDTYEVTINLKEPVGTLIMLLTKQPEGSYVYPKELVDASKNADGTYEELSEYIGTGPYKFVEWLPGQHVLVERYDDYKSRDEPPNGFVGGKTAYVDKIYFVAGVGEPAARLAGLEAGDYHHTFLAAADVEYAKTNPELKVFSVPRFYGFAQMNHSQGVMADSVMRQAFAAALCGEDVMKIWMPGMYTMDPSFLAPDHSLWTDEGDDIYNQCDPDKAKELLEQAGYQGEEVIWLAPAATLDYDKRGLSAKSQLEKAGFNVHYEVMDRGAMQERIEKKEGWHIYEMGLLFYPDPTMYPFWDPEWPGWWENEEKDDLVAILNREHDFDIRHDAVMQLQDLLYQDLPNVKYGNVAQGFAIRKSVNGYVNVLTPFFWNVWLEE